MAGAARAGGGEMRRLVIATRRSRLALWQAEHVKQRLGGLHAGLAGGRLPLSTRGDEILDRRLDQAGGKGLFVKELENALADRRADLAVHSVKDAPADLPPGFVLAAVMAREDPRDALVSKSFETLASLPKGGVVGTSSLRRAAQIAERYTQLELKLLRGNVETRLAKLDRAEYAAIIPAGAGPRQRGDAAPQARSRRVRRDHPRGGGPRAPGARLAHSFTPGRGRQPSGPRPGRARHRMSRRERRSGLAARAAERCGDRALRAG